MTYSMTIRNLGFLVMVLASACGRGRPDVAGVYLFSASAPGVRFPGSIELLEASDRIWGRVTAVIGGANQHILVRSVETRGRHLTLMLAAPTGSGDPTSMSRGATRRDILKCGTWEGPSTTS